jgi:hypothetical protein
MQQTSLRRSGSRGTQNCLKGYTSVSRRKSLRLKPFGSLLSPRNEFAIRLRELLYDDRRAPRSGLESLLKRYRRISAALLDMTYPLEPKKPEMDISGFAGSEQVKEKMATFDGSPIGVRGIIESRIVLVQHYSGLVGSGDFEAAYALTESGLRAWMSFKRFVGDHERAAQEFHGPALQFLINRINYVYADNAARKKSNTSVEGWPKGTPKENRRAGVSGFWIRDRAAQTGCGGTLWVAEEEGQYRIAKFDFWRP